MAAPIDDTINVIAPLGRLKYFFFWAKPMLSVTFIVKFSSITGFSNQNLIHAIEILMTPFDLPRFLATTGCLQRGRRTDGRTGGHSNAFLRKILSYIT